MTSVLCLIPARGGSKGIPRKNLKPLLGKPLIAWTIQAAMQSKLIDRIVVSTDDAEIAEISRGFGAEVPFIRPARISTDTSSSIEAVLHAIEKLPKYDWVLVLQPTSPLRTTADIDGILNFCMESDASSATSICLVAQHPYWMYRKNQSLRLEPLFEGGEMITRRQDLPPMYALNGALYLARTSWFLERRILVGRDTLGYVMPSTRSADLDTPLDWEWVEHLLGEW